MRESQLINKMNEISTKLKNSKIFDNCCLIVKRYGIGEINMYGPYTNSKHQYHQDNLLISLNDGWSIEGGGDIRVFYKNQEVLYADRDATNKKENKFHPKINGFCILNYLPGEWEKKVNDILNKKEIKKNQKNKL
jgi:uncharacterized protein YwgA